MRVTTSDVESSPVSPGAQAERAREQVRPRWRALSRANAAGLVLIGAAATLYVLTLDNGLRPGELLGGDLITHQYAQVLGRPSNAPGYPLYTMGGWLWFHGWRLLLGTQANPIPILAGYSTVWALVALWVLYRLVLEITDRGNGGNWVVALGTGAFYAVTYFFWYYAVTTEQYTSAVAWTLAVVWLAFRWQRTRRDRYLLAIALLAGIGLAHQVTILFIIPPLLWFALREDPGLLRRPKLIVTALALAALPLASYAYVYIRGSQHPEWWGAGAWQSTWQWFWSFVSTRQGREELTWSWTPLLTSEFPRLIWEELSWPVLIAGLAGIAGLGGRRATALYATLAIYLVFCWIDRLGNWYQVIMPAYALILLGAGWLADWAWRRGGQGSMARWAVSLALVALVAYRGLLSFSEADCRDRAGDTGLAPGWALLADNPPAGSAIWATLPETASLNYLTQIWGLRPDLRLVSGEQARSILAAGSPPLLASSGVLSLVPAEVDPSAHYGAAGSSLVSLTQSPARTPPWITDGSSEAVLESWRHDFGLALRLLGGRVAGTGVPGKMVVSLLWEARAAPAEDWSISVRLTQRGEEIGQKDLVHPVFGAYPTSRWSAGEVVGDVYTIEVPEGRTPDGLTVILYRQLPDGSFENLDIARFPLSG